MSVRRTAARLGAGWVLWRLLRPSPAPQHHGVQARPPAPVGHTVVVGRHEFFMREAGPAGAAQVLLIHGWAFDSLAAWHRVLPFLEGRLRVLAVDLRGHGKSDRIRGRFDVEDLADDMAAVLDRLGVARVTVVGYSLGGLVAQSLARRHPARVERLVLAATAARPLWLPRPAATGLFLASRALARLDPSVIPRFVHRYLIRRGVVPAQHAAWLWESLAGRDPELHHEAAFAMARFDARPWVGRLRLPTLCLVPNRDQLIPASRQRATAALIPGAAVVEIRGARHEAVLTHPEEVAEAVVSFVAGGAGAPPAAERSGSPS